MIAEAGVRFDEIGIAIDEGERFGTGLFEDRGVVGDAAAGETRLTMSLPEPVRVRLAYSPHTVIGYHGCSRETARRILSGAPLLPSANEWDWLGEGVYFGENAPARAYEWACQRFCSEAAILEARIRLGRCLNLLDTQHFADLRRAYAVVVAELTAKSLPIPENKPDGRRFLDQRVINLYCRLRGEVSGRPYQTVRGCFPEGEPLYSGSAVLSKTHIQVAVRDGRCLERVRWVYCE